MVDIKADPYFVNDETHVKLDPEREVKVANAQGLDECVKLLRMAKAGKYNGYLLEGMMNNFYIARPSTIINEYSKI